MTINADINKLRRYKNTENLVWIGGFGIGIVLGFVAAEEILKIYAFILFFILVGSTLFVMSRTCPNCGEYFHGNSPIWGNTLRRTCVHCGIGLSRKNA
jgi:ribosomal protein S27AE